MYKLLAGLLRVFSPCALAALEVAVVKFEGSVKVGADAATALQGGRAKDALLAVADDETAN